ncbi:uncharacterized protein BJ212DRAFT_680754 [Suillus subaureus]|uniref:Uncharacterized protein n=1 Tax=Suillus subaureus TaxID=48587 RepID=A0A9P7JHR2_9AGAM|nr:uncharacterized protein BJ212DRAFT_680754 [Suillus subaureus]KAG1823453.1 hypothetical protein BJ212DRAFT_680754 [Suillus subaureus]
MMTARFLVHILNTLKKWLSQLARRFAGPLSLFLSLLRQFASGHLKLGACGRRLFVGTRFSGEALPRSQGNIAREDAPICSSSVPPSDDPYSIYPQNSQHLQKVTVTPLSQTNTTIRNGSTAEIDGGSISGLHQSSQTRENSGSRTSHGNPLEGSSSPGPSSLHGLPGSHPRSQICTNDARFPVAAPTSSTTLRTIHPNHSFSSQGSRQSITGLRPHGLEHVYHIANDIHNSIAPQSELPYPGTGHRVRWTAPPGSDDSKPGSKIVEDHEDKPDVFPMVAAGVMRYQRCIPRRVADSIQTTVPAMTITFPTYDSMVDVSPWTTHVHPEGSRYFLNKDQVRKVHR